MIDPLFEKIDEIRKKVSEDAFNLALCYTNLKDKGNEIMDSGFAVCYDQFVQYGRQEGKQEGFFELLFQLVEDGDLSLEKAAKKAGLTVNEFLEKKEEFSGT
mgnify:FL=1